MPYANPEMRFTEFWHYAELTDEALQQVNDAAVALDVARNANFREWHLYIKRRPRERSPRLWNATGGQYVRHVGPKKPTVDFRKLPEPHLTYIRTRAAVARQSMEVVPTTVVLDESGARLLTETAEPLSA